MWTSSTLKTVFFATSSVFLTAVHNQAVALDVCTTVLRKDAVIKGTSESES